MRIAFLCGSIEAGKNGVGDYTRKLAGELIRQGHAVAVVSVNDSYVPNIYVGTQKANGLELPVLRVNSIQTFSKNCKAVTEWVNHFNPDWISIQFVPFSFQSKGLPLFLSRQLKIITKNRQIHLMFHEGWIGCGKSWRLKLYSKLQKTLIKNFLVNLRPQVIHTHLPFYKVQLEKLGWKVKVLPLFSNIAVNTSTAEFLEKTVLRAGIFSQVEVNEAITTFLKLFEKEATSLNTPFEILLIGGGEKRMQLVQGMLAKVISLNTSVKYTGFLEEKELSSALKSCAIGVTSVPRHALGKSGSVAAFLSHGIPVAAPNIMKGYCSHNIGFFPLELCSSIVLEPKLDSVKRAKEAVLTAKNKLQLSTIAKTFLLDLNYF